MSGPEIRAPCRIGRGLLVAGCLRFHTVFRTRHRLRPLFPVAIVAFLSLAACAPSEPAPRRAGPPFLLLHDWYGKSPVATPSYIRDHREYLDSLPFDGIVAYLRTPDGALNVSASVLNPGELSDAQFAEALAPLAGLRFRNLTENFAAVLGGRPPDFMDDWTAVIRNFGRLARAARETGLRGIYVDNETYYSPWSDYPKGVRHPEKPLREYQDQARRRGREVMEAMTAEFPGITVILLHGPYISEPRAPAALFPQVQSNNELHGPFFVGFCEGAGPRARVVDGGELYHLRADSEFRENRDWRKRAFPSNGIDCAYLPTELRESWPERVGVAFGVYDRPFKGRPMDPVVLAATLSRALRHADRYAWLYVEGPSFLKPPGEGGAPAEWIEAVRRAKAP